MFRLPLSLISAFTLAITDALTKRVFGAVIMLAGVFLIGCFS